MTSCDKHGQPLLSGDIFTILHLLEDQPADWFLSARSGNFKLVIKWKQQQQQDNVEIPRQKKRRKVSDARRQRNHQRLQAYRAKKAESAGKSAQLTELKELYKLTTTDDMETSDQFIDDDPLLDIQEKSYQTDSSFEIPPTPGKDLPPDSPPKAEAKPTEMITAGKDSSTKDKDDEDDEIVADTIEKIVYYRDNNSYLLKVKHFDIILAIDQGNCKCYKAYTLEQDSHQYKQTLKRFTKWNDIRERKSFTFKEDRLEDIHRIERNHNIKFDNYTQKI